MAKLEKWREALAEGKVAGSIWRGRKRGAHLKNQHQKVDSDKVAVAAGNQFYSVWVHAYPKKVVVTHHDKTGKRILREEFPTP